MKRGKMRNSTLSRSNLTKERMALLEELKQESAQSQNSGPGVYIRPNKEKELDALWQNFRVNSKHDNSPGVYLVTGFVVGAICMFLMSAMMTFGSRTVVNNSEMQELTPAPVKHSKLVKKPRAQKSKLTILPADNAAEIKASNEVYTVQNGDTLENIIIRFYGKYDASKIEKIQQANSMSNPNMLSIGQKLSIPLD